MNFDLELAQLDRRQQWLQQAAWLLVPCIVLTLAATDVFYPGSFGAAHLFQNVQIPLDVLGYFRGQGVETSLFEDRMVMGVRMGAVQGVLSVIKLALIIVGMGSLLRLQPRWAAGCAILWYGLASLSDSWMTHGGYSVANPLQFGIHQLGARVPDSPIQPLAPTDAIPTFSDISRKLGNAVASDQIHAEIERRAQDREMRAMRLRSLAENPEGFPANQAAALHYIAAQIGYLEDDEAAVERHLSAIPAAQFHATWDCDYRLRIMQEWLVKQGGNLPIDAYRPTTGMPFAVSRFIAAAFAALGGMLLVTMALAVHFRRNLAQRLERMRTMAAELLNASIARSTPPPDQFGRRLIKPVPVLETNSSARRS
ncbi:MAG TPA: hypothetical protein VGH23_17265 [Rhizomicrobium sp.]|jgi:hypothetical protein